jgi:hypothetical protein
MAILTWRCLLAALGRVGMHLMAEVGLCQTFDPNGRLHQHWTGSNEGTYDNEKDYRRCSYRALPCRVLAR